MPSAKSGHVYQVHPAGLGCSCKWNQETGRACAHMLAVRLAHDEDALAEAERDAAHEYEVGRASCRERV